MSIRGPEGMDRSIKSGIVVIAVVIAATAAGVEMPRGKKYTNSIGMKFVRMEPGSFMMGSNAAGANWDEQPVHKVTITYPSYFSETEVTSEHFRQFRKEFSGTVELEPYVGGVSWYDAVEFCKWLSNREGKTYRLATEAEWEYVCKNQNSSAETPKNMLTDPVEWCNDWYGNYPSGGQIDPVGPDHGMTRVVRGGALDETKESEIYARGENRAAMAPTFGPYEGSANKFGLHKIGFRVVLAPLPKTVPLRYEPPFTNQGIKQNTDIARVGPDPAKPYFRKRHMLPTPPENCPRAVIDAAGLHAAFRGHNHSPGFEVCPNGDLLLAIHTSYHEYEPEVAVMGARLRFGADEWSMPDIIFDFPGAGDPSPMLYNDGGTLYFFCGSPRMKGAYPFHWTTSTDNGATWSEYRFPKFTNKVGPHSRQPINTALRGRDGTLYVSSDGKGGTSILWATADNGKTWTDPGGRTGGRHTTFVLLKDGGILGMGGKNTNIDGFMPKSVSYDGGKTWAVSKTVFPAQGSNQRPSILRLRSGRLFFAGDFQHISGRQPEGVTRKGSYVALSEDEGQSWVVKKLIGTQPHENPKRHNGAETIGYSVARQGPDGIIHLITTMNRPCLHLAFNEAWIIQKSSECKPDAELERSGATSASNLKRYEEKYPNGQTRLTYSIAVAGEEGGLPCRGAAGTSRLHGPEIWFYGNGEKRYEATYRLGRKTGPETYWASGGKKRWEWTHNEDGTSVWTQWWPGGGKKAESTWRNFKCHGTAKKWDKSGRLISEKTFVDGQMID